MNICTIANMLNVIIAYKTIVIYSHLTEIIKPGNTCML